jgi:nucleolar protein 58
LYGVITDVTFCAAGLKKFLKKHAVGDTLAVLDAKLGGLIKEKLEINCVHK